MWILSTNSYYRLVPGVWVQYSSGRLGIKASQLFPLYLSFDTGLFDVILDKPSYSSMIYIYYFLNGSSFSENPFHIKNKNSDDII